MEKFRLAIGIHNHQPVGNFEHVFEEAHSQAYEPFLRLLQKFDNLKLSLHQSGILWDWQEKHHPEYFEMVRQLIKNGQIELMTGGFYEPILPSIPDRDKLGQIDLLNRYLKEKFNSDTTGLWLTERVWEPQLPKILAQAGVKYLPVDDTHFLYAGFELEDLKGIFITEDDGRTVKLLPIQKRLRYLIPFGTVDKVIAELKNQEDKNPAGLAIYADDGEKFGVWPKTHQHCYTDGWLERFFEALEANSDWLEICTLGEAAQTKPVGTAYLQTASYAEMLHWALPPKAFAEYEQFEEWLKENGKLEQYSRFVRGGHWRGFLAKYPESNLMHKKMLTVSEKLENFRPNHSDKSEQISRAREYLYAGQCNCPYWHGVFGGLYLPHLRRAIFENLIKAEKELGEANHKNIVRTISDYDCDGNEEIVITTNKFSTVIRPATGGMMLELNSFEDNFNLTDILNRRREGYHWKLTKAKMNGTHDADETASIHDLVLTKEEGLEKYLADDWYTRRCFIDHFITADVTVDDFLSGRFRDEGDFVLEPYEYEQASDDSTLILAREGRLWRNDTSKRLQVKKSFRFGLQSEVISVNYSLTAPDEDLPDVLLAVENNFNFQAGHADDRYVLFDGKRESGGYLDAVVGRDNCRRVIMRDDWRNLAVGLLIDREAEVWQAPIFTISLSESGFEKVYQGTSLVHIVRTDLKKGRPFEICFLLFAGRPENMPNRFLKKKSVPVAVE